MPEYPGQTIYPPTGYPLPPPPAYTKTPPEVEEEVFTCRYCGKEFDSAGALRLHETHCALNPANMGEEEGEIITCPYCGMEVATADGLAIHVAVCLSNPANMVEGGGDMPAGLGVEEAYGPFAQYMRRMGLGEGYQTPAQTYMRGLYEPMRGLHEMQGLYGHATMGAETPYWGDFMGQYAGKPRSVYEQYGGLLGGLFGMSPEQRQTFGMGFEPQYGEFGTQLPMGETGMRPLSELQSLMAGGLIPQMGPRGAGWLAQRLPFMQQQWEVQQPGMPFMDYIRQKYNLGQYF